MVFTLIQQKLVGAVLCCTVLFGGSGALRLRYLDLADIAKLQLAHANRFLGRCSARLFMTLDALPISTLTVLIMVWCCNEIYRRTRDFFCWSVLQPIEQQAHGSKLNSGARFARPIR